MFNREMVVIILKGIADLNTKMGIWAIIIPVVFAIAVILMVVAAYKKPGRQSSAILLGTLAIIYIFSGFTILVNINQMGNTAWVGAIGLWLVAVLLILDVIFNWTKISLSEKLDLKILAILLMITGIFVYPVVEIALGFNWPGMVLFSAECPTTIFLIGLMIGSIPRVNKVLLVIISLNAMSTGISVALNGATFDYLYGVAGIIGVIMMIKYFKPIFIKRVS